MPFMEEDWGDVILGLGFTSEKEMLTDLYVTQGFSLSQLSDVIGHSAPTIRRRLIQNGITLRPRGGANHNKTKLQDVPDELLFGLTQSNVAKRYSVDESTVYLERKRRKERESELRDNSTNEVASPGPTDR